MSSQATTVPPPHVRSALAGETSGGPDFGITFGALAPREVFPEVELTTDRLRLRAYTEADIDDQVAMFDHEIVRLWSNGPQPYTREHGRAWCTRLAAEIRTSGEGVCWAVTDRVTGRLLGCTGLHHTDWRNRVTDGSATGAPWAVGHGYAKEALRAISRWALVDQRFNRLQITAATGNPAPQRVAAACGFVKEGILRNAESRRQGQVDLVMYSLVPGDLDHPTTPRTQKGGATPHTSRTKRPSLSHTGGQQAPKHPRAG